MAHYRCGQKTGRILTAVNQLPIFNGKQIASLFVDGIDADDSPNYSDAYFSDGYYVNNEPLTQSELDNLTLLYPDIVLSLI